MAQERFCYDCKHYRALIPFVRLESCAHPEASKRGSYYATGKLPVCFIERGFNEPCGPDGKHWEKAPLRWKFWVICTAIIVFCIRGIIHNS